MPIMKACSFWVSVVGQFKPKEDVMPDHPSTQIDPEEDTEVTAEVQQHPEAQQSSQAENTNQEAPAAQEDPKVQEDREE